jgi:hypothetical protein
MEAEIGTVEGAESGLDERTPIRDFAQTGEEKHKAEGSKQHIKDHPPQIVIKLGQPTDAPADMDQQIGQQICNLSPNEGHSINSLVA